MTALLQMRRRLADLRGRGVYAGWPNENRAIFIHLPKTAGTSVSKALDLPSSRHIPAEEYRKSNPDKFEKFFKFAFVRNPYDRLLSSYAFLRDGGMNDDDAQFARRYVQIYPSFEHFLIEGLANCVEIQAWVHFRPQVTFVCDKPGRNLMDFTGRYERLAEDYANVAAHLGRPGELPFTNNSRRGDYREVYTPTMIDVVSRLYASDLKIFGYGFE
ncbi:sulfotransferase family 2 domain-containing protein [Parvularcula sp. IMCC14364]|uniref:sulfotransferase family 2 domain-containing protein n=1 Tax=Parvularcula sp. IMCC14364 TaxID=3067902 RepID=UPI002741B872|nr:sulfotransferase family 2 domain-containing protein [Parvularcula sp. IMCC14364]